MNIDLTDDESSAIYTGEKPSYLFSSKESNLKVNQIQPAEDSRGSAEVCFGNTLL